MTQFVCRVGAPDGSIRTEIISAENPEALKRQLQEKGLYPFSVKRRALLDFRFLAGKGEKIPVEAFTIFNQELATLLKAGLPLLTSVEVLAERQKSKIFKKVLSDVIVRIRSGESLSDAFSAYGELFPKLYVTSLKSGERSGDLETVIRRYIEYQKIILMVRRRVKGALVYPMVLLGLSLVLIVVMLTFVIPKFTSFYGEMGSDLPFLTAVVVALSSFVISNGPYLVAASLVGASLLYSWAKTPMGRRSLDALWLRVPLVGPIMHLFAVTQFSRSLATLIGGGTPAVNALETAADTVANQEISLAIKNIVPRVKEGESLWGSLESTGKLPDVSIEMIKVGEATGALQEMLYSASEFFDEEINTRLSQLVTLIEPLMLVFMGSIVATLLASVYLPLIYVVGHLK